MSNKTMNFAPKNIRQIGVTLPNDKIYIEDYVMTYIKQLFDVLSEENRILVLVGNTYTEGEINYSCISGVVELKENNESYSYTELLRGENIKKLTRIKEDYYGELDFVGLCVLSRNEWIKFSDDLYMYFQDGMMGDLLLVRDEVNEEQVFKYRNTNFIKQRGYYIYYDRNESMQNYMLCMKDGKSIEYGYSPSEIIDRNIDEKIRSFSIPKNDVYTGSGIPHERYKKIIEYKWNNKWKYGVASVAVIAILIAGVMKVDKLEKITRQKASQLVDKTTDVINNDSDKLEVETVTSELVMKENFGQEVEANVEEVAEGDQIKSEEMEEGLEKSQGKDESAKQGEGLEDSQEKSKEMIQGGEVEIVKQKIDKQENKGKEEKTVGSTQVIKEAVRYYIVRKGDALVDISRRMYGTHKKATVIKKANGIEDEDKIFIGQRLVIP